MIVGIGTDLIETERVKKACEKSGFMNRCYTEQERSDFNGRYQELAGNFSVKESVAKSFGTGFRGFGFNDIEVLRDNLGKPYVKLYGGALEKARELGINKIHVTITNVKEYAQAFVVSERV